MSEPHVRLVRDFVPALAAQNGDHPAFDVVLPETRDRLLVDKLLEEVRELADVNEEEAVFRLATVWELVIEIAETYELTAKDLREAALVIKQTKGGFQHGYVVREP